MKKIKKISSLLLSLILIFTTYVPSQVLAEELIGEDVIVDTTENQEIEPTEEVVNLNDNIQEEEQNENDKLDEEIKKIEEEILNNDNNENIETENLEENQESEVHEEEVIQEDENSIEEIETSENNIDDDLEENNEAILENKNNESSTNQTEEENLEEIILENDTDEVDDKTKNNEEEILNSNNENTETENVEENQESKINEEEVTVKVDENNIDDNSEESNKADENTELINQNEEINEFLIDKELDEEEKINNENNEEIEISNEDIIKTKQIKINGYEATVQIKKDKVVEIKEDQEAIFVSEVDDIKYKNIKPTNEKIEMKIRDMQGVDSQDIVEVKVKDLKEDISNMVDSEVLEEIVPDSAVEITIENKENNLEINENLDIELKIDWEDNNNDGIVDGTNLKEEDIIPAYFDDQTGELKTDGIIVVNKDNENNFLLFKTSHLTSFVIVNFVWVAGAEPPSSPDEDAYIEVGSISSNKAISEGKRAVLVMNITNGFSYGKVRKINSITIDNDSNGGTAANYQIDHVTIFKDSDGNGEFNPVNDDEVTMNGISNSMAHNGSITLDVTSNELTNTTPNSIGIGLTTSFFIVFDYSKINPANSSDGNIINAKVTSIELIDGDTGNCPPDGCRVNNNANTMDPPEFIIIDDLAPSITSFSAPTAQSWPGVKEYTSQNTYNVSGTYSADSDDEVTFKVYHDVDNNGYYTMGGSDILLGQVIMPKGSSSFSLNVDLSGVTNQEVKFLVFAEDDVGNSNMPTAGVVKGLTYPTKPTAAPGLNSVLPPTANRVIVVHDTVKPTVKSVFTSDNDNGRSDGIIDTVIVVYDDSNGIAVSSIHQNDIYLPSGGVVSAVEFTDNDSDGLVDIGDANGDGIDDGPLVKYKLRNVSSNTGETPTITIFHGSVRDMAGNDLDSGWNGGVPAADGAGPVIIEAETLDLDGNGNLDGILVTFSEDVNDTSLDNSDFNFSGSVTGNPTAITKINDKKYILKFTSSANNNTDGGAITITTAQDSIQDINGNNTNEGVSTFSNITDGAVFSPNNARVIIDNGGGITYDLINSSNINNTTVRVYFDSQVNTIGDGSEGSWSNITASVELTDGVTTVTKNQPITNPGGNNFIDITNINTSTLLETNIAVKAKFIDDNGNESVISSTPLEYGYKSFTAANKQTQLPVIYIPIGGEITSPTNDNTPQFTINSTKAGTLKIFGDCDSTPATPDTFNILTDNNSHNIDLPFSGGTLADGEYNNCTLQLEDNFGNSSNIIGINTFVVDTAPSNSANITITQPASKIYINNNDYTIKGIFSAEESDMRFLAYIDSNNDGQIDINSTPISEVLVPGGAGLTNFSIPVNLVENFENNFLVVAKDEANNLSNPVDVFTIVEDSQAPIIVELDPVSPALTNDPTPNYRFSIDEINNIETLEFLGDCNTATIINHTSPVPSLQPYLVTIDSDGQGGNLSDGLYDNCMIVATDTAGNSSGNVHISDFTVDTNSPTITEEVAIISPTNNKNPQYTFSSNENGTINVTGSGCNIDDNSASIGNNTVTFQNSGGGELNDGTYNCQITVTDDANNTPSNTLNVNFILDTQSPIISWNPVLLQPGINEKYTNNQKPIYGTLSSNDVLTGEIIIEGDGCYSPQEGQELAGGTTVDIQFTSFSEDNLSEASYECIVKIKDESNNFSNELEANFTIDITAPVILENKKVTPTTTNDPQPKYEFYTNEKSTTNGLIISGNGCHINGNTSFTVTQAGFTEITLTESSGGNMGGSGQEGQEYNCTLVITDIAGNTSQPLNMSSFTVDNQAPAVSFANSFVFPSRTNNQRPEVKFISNEDGRVQVTGDCGSDRDGDNAFKVVNNTLTLDDGTGGPLLDSGTGKYQCKVTVEDTAGNIGELLLPDINGFSVDITPPNNTSILIPSEEIRINADGHRIEGIFEAIGNDTSVTVKIYKDLDNDTSYLDEDQTPVATSIISINSGHGQYAFSFTNLQIPLEQDSDNNFVAVFIDDLGNESVVLDIPTITEDSTVPTLILTTPVPDITGNRNPTITFTSDSEGTISFLTGTGTTCTSDTTEAVIGENTIILKDAMTGDGKFNSGEYTCILQITDDVLNIGQLNINHIEDDPLTPKTFKIDIDEPIILITDPVSLSPPSNDNTPEIQFTTTEAGRLEIIGECGSESSHTDLTPSMIYNNGIDDSGGLKKISINLRDDSGTPLSDGTYNGGDCKIKITDSSNNESIIDIPSFAIDSTAPVIYVAQDGEVETPTRNPNPEYIFKSTEEGQIDISGDCQSVQHGAMAVDQNTGENTIIFDSDGAGTEITPNGTEIEFSGCEISITDSSGNKSNTLIVNSFKVDRKAPEGLEIISPNVNKVVDQDFFTIEGKFTAEPSDLKVYVYNTADDFIVETITISDSNISQFSIPVPLIQGESAGGALNKFYVILEDDLGNKTLKTDINAILPDILEDSTDPTVSVFSVSGNTGSFPISTTDKTPEIIINAVDAESGIEEVKALIAGKYYDAEHLSGNNWIINDNVITPELSEGTYEILLEVKNGVEKVVNDSDSNELKIDVAPVVSIKNGANLLPIETNDRTPEISGEVTDIDLENVSMTITINSINYTNIGNDPDIIIDENLNTWTLQNNKISPPLPDGEYEISVSATDAAGNVGTDSTTDELKIDAAPNVNITNIDGQNYVSPTAVTTSDSTPSISGQIDDPDANIIIYIDREVNGNTIRDMYVAQNNATTLGTMGPWILADDSITNALLDGTYDILVMATDMALNVGSDSTTDELIIDSHPNITSVNLRSNNALTNFEEANTDDIVKLTFIVDQPILEDLSNPSDPSPKVIFNSGATTRDSSNSGHGVTINKVTGNVWEAYYKVDDNSIIDDGGNVTFAIYFKDLNGNPGLAPHPVTNVTDGSSVVIDKAHAIISNLFIRSSNSNTEIAGHGETVTITFNSNEPITPAVRFFTDIKEVAQSRITGPTDTSSGNRTSWESSFIIDKNIDLSGDIRFIIDYEDDLTNSDTIDNTVGSDAKGTVVDLDPPEFQYITSTNSNDAYKDTEQINIVAKYSEAIKTGSSVDINLDTGVTITLNSISGDEISGTYTVASGQNSNDLTGISLANESISDMTNNIQNSSVISIPNSNLGNRKDIIIDTTNPTITIIPNTKTKNSPITDTNINITDVGGILSTDISVDSSSTVGHSNLNCNQTNNNTVDCTISINSSGAIAIKAIDKAGNENINSESGYIINSTLPVISITAPTKTNNTNILDTTIRVTSPSTIDASGVVVDPSSTTTTDFFNCNQVDANTVDCQLVIKSSGNLIIKATDNATNTTTATESNYVINNTVPVISINAPNKTSTSSITDTTILITDSGGILSSNVTVDPSTTTTTTNFNCTQTNVNTVDCTISIDSSGNLVIKADDGQGNISTETETGYIINSGNPIINITAPTKTSSSSISNTTINVTATAGILSSNVTVDPSTTATTSNFNCTQTNANTVDCTISIDSSGNLVIKATDNSSSSSTKNENNYLIDANNPTITINAPTKTSSVSINNTTINVTDSGGILSSNVTVDPSTTATTSNFNCTQTNANTVDCTISIDSSGNLVIKATDNASHTATATETGYIINSSIPAVTITAPTKNMQPNITDTTIRATSSNGINASNVIVDPSTTVNHSNFNCTQTNANTVDCTIIITSGGNLVIKATDNSSLVATDTEPNYMTADTTVTLRPGWNVFSVPRRLSNIQWSANGNSGMAFYTMEAGQMSTSSVAVNITNIIPLKGFFVNNTSGSNIEIYLTYASNPSGVVQSQTFSSGVGWYLIGVAHSSFQANSSNYTEVSVSNALNNMSSNDYGDVIDYTTTNFLGNDNNNLKDSVTQISDITGKFFEEFKAYVIYIKNANAVYSGAQQPQ